ncbi:hypothetical protein [Nonomuraea sp. NPDC050202]|uniref:hypothetical protein n=1 Tax=Nonomuraea sp. NPDC050202 TaxID=3155035 RepID=UPI0033DEE0C2
MLTSACLLDLHRDDGFYQGKLLHRSPFGARRVSNSNGRLMRGIDRSHGTLLLTADALLPISPQTVARGAIIRFTTRERGQAPARACDAATVRGTGLERRCELPHRTSAAPACTRSIKAAACCIDHYPFAKPVRAMTPEGL